MSYFIPGQIYTFRSLNPAENITNVISIEFDDDANASVTISSDSVLPSDILANYVFAPEDQMEFNPATSILSLTGDLNKFWFIYFDNPNVNYDNASATGGGNDITVSCSCKKGSGTCTANGGIQDGVLCVSCNPDSSACENCKEPVYTNSDTGIYLSVCIKAESVQILS